MYYERILAYMSDGRVVEIKDSIYPDNVPIVLHNINLEGKASIKSILVRPLTMTDLLAALFFVDAWVWRGGNVPDLVLPCVPGARQDRMNDAGDYLFTAKSIANMINQRNFPKVTILDPHSEVISGLINNCKVVHSSCLVRSSGYFYGSDYKAVVSPDAGAEKRAGKFAWNMGIPLVHAWKSRSVKDGSISGFGYENVLEYGDKVLVVDDICDGGGTFLGLKEELSKQSIVADLFVTHGIFSKGVKELTSKFNKVYTTDSIINRSDCIPGVTVIEICKKLMKGDILIR